MPNYAAILDVYSLEDILDHNDITVEDCLIFLCEEGFLHLPSVNPIDFDD